jgi:4-hydroxy-tetrahydrodipicolinate synthase
LIAYNIPSRCVVDVPNELLREMAATIPNVQAVKQANNDNLAAIDGLDLLAGNDDVLARTMDAGGTGGILVASHLFGNEMKRIVEEPASRQEVHESLKDAYAALGVATNPMPIKTALRLAGHQVGGFRLPMVDLSEDEEAVVREMLERYGLLSAV